MLFNTLLAGAEGVEQDLVQAESPFAGSRKFGMCYVDRETGHMATVGECAVGESSLASLCVQ